MTQNLKNSDTGKLLLFQYMKQSLIFKIWFYFMKVKVYRPTIKNDLYSRSFICFVLLYLYATKTFPRIFILESMAFLVCWFEWSPPSFFMETG